MIKYLIFSYSTQQILVFIFSKKLKTAVFVVVVAS